jgi:dipeptidyl aminopeptidase/acylaminoacyl peptidase
VIRGRAAAAGVLAAGLPVTLLLLVSRAQQPGPADMPQEMVWVDRQGRVLGRAGAVQDAIFYPELSPDNRLVAVSARDRGQAGGRGIFVHDLAAGTKRRLTESSGNDNLPVWSPDGRRIAFTSSRTGNYDLYVKSIDPDEPETLLLGSERREFTNHWSPDGRLISFTRDGGATAPAREILMLTAADPAQGPMPFLRHAGAWVDGAEFSPDGRHLAYASNAGGQFEVHVALVAEPSRTQVASRGLSLGWAGGGGQPRWRDDGRELFYMIGDTMMSVEVRSSDPITFGTPSRLFALPGMKGHFPDEMPWLQKYDVAADGQRFLFVRAVVP